MPLQFQCNCGRQLRARDESAGKFVRCPQCGGSVQVPTVRTAEEVQRTAPTTLIVPQSALAGTGPRAIHDEGSSRVSLALESASVGQILTGIVIVWAVLIVLTIALAAVSKLQAAVLAILTGAVTLFFVFAALDLMRAKRYAVKYGEGSAWFGLCCIVAWDPNQGVLFLKDKMIGPVDSNPNDGGGVMLLLPWLGEEIAFRAPLEVRTTKFEDKDVLTREYVPVTIKGAIYWRVADLERFYLSVSRGIHQVDDGGRHYVSHGYDPHNVHDKHSLRAGTAQQLEAGEEWLRLIAEEQTRAEVVNARTGLLVADKIVEGLPPAMQSLVASDSYHKAADGLAESIRNRIEMIGSPYGIQVDRVSLQEVQLDPKIRAAAVAACVSAYKPLIAQRDATAKKMDLEANAFGQKRMIEGEAEIIGKEAVAKRQVLGSVQPFAFGGRMGVVDVLGQFFDDFSAGAPDAREPSRQLSRSQPRPQAKSEPPQGRELRWEDADEPVFEDEEASAKDLLNQAKQYHSAGQVESAIALLEQIVGQYGATHAAEYARKNLVILKKKQNPWREL